MDRSELVVLFNPSAHTFAPVRTVNYEDKRCRHMCAHSRTPCPGDFCNSSNNTQAFKRLGWWKPCPSIDKVSEKTRLCEAIETCFVTRSTGGSCSWQQQLTAEMTDNSTIPKIHFPCKLSLRLGFRGVPCTKLLNLPHLFITCRCDTNVPGTELTLDCSKTSWLV